MRVNKQYEVTRFSTHSQVVMAFQKATAQANPERKFLSQYSGSALSSINKGLQDGSREWMDQARLQSQMKPQMLQFHPAGVF